MRDKFRLDFTIVNRFIVVDRAVTLLTSASFSCRAENSKIELGLLVQDTALASSIESTMRDKHGVLYERVVPSQTQRCELSTRTRLPRLVAVVRSPLEMLTGISRAGFPIGLTTPSPRIHRQSSYRG